jgi:putative peptidoglycan lipid II flippase
MLQWMVLWPSLRREWLKVWLDAEKSSPVLPAANLRSGHAPADVRLLPAKKGDLLGQLRRIRLGMIPTMLALTVTQLNTLSDSLVAWVLAAPRSGVHTIAWLGNISYPLEQGAVAAIYFGERLYQFPLGLIGIAAATVAFPLLSQHAARGDRAALAGDLTLGLRMVLLAAVPCAVGLVVLAKPIARLLFEHGQFTAADAARAARMIAVYGAAVWAYCSLPVLVRGFYAVGDRITPLRLALGVVALNLVLDFTLIWPLAEAGLAASTAISAVVQGAVLAVWFSQRHVRLMWRTLAVTALRAGLASAAMAGVCLLVLDHIPVQAGTWNALWRVVGSLVAGAAVYVGILALIGRSEWRDLQGRH